MNSKNIVLTTLLLFFITLEILIAIDYVSNQRDIGAQRNSIFNNFIELQNQLGFTGLIHNFKNYILRPTEPIYHENAINNYHKAMAKLQEIENTDITYVSKIDLPHSKAMLEAYKQRLELLPELISKNLNSREIDKAVRYDDAPSHTEIQNISALVAYELESQISNILYRSLILGGLVLLALLMTLIAINRFFFKDQHKLLQFTANQNAEMQQHKSDMQRSQSILISVLQDVDREKRQTAILNKKLESKNKEMEQFIYTVSHDLKSPLVTINAFSEKLLSELESNITEKQAYRIKRIIDNVKNMDCLLTDLLNLSRLGQQDISTTEIDIKSIVDEQSNALENIINDSQTTICLAENLHKVTANPRLLSEALLNLLTNAIRYRDPSRKLIIDIFTTHLATSTTLHVKDNGIGIDPKYHQLIFNIFERLSTGEGTGVGLTIVKTIMDKHNGKISVKSALNVGSCFSLTFPDYPSTKTQ